jgi:hypothetical protein
VVAAGWKLLGYVIEMAEMQLQPWMNKNPWEQGRYGQAFTFTGNDYLRSIKSIYRGNYWNSMPGLFPCGLKPRIKIGEYRLLGTVIVNGQRWWFRMYRNQLQDAFS